MAICGPMMATVGLIISTWGAIQLGLMGVFFWNNSVSLVEDLHMNASETITSAGEFYKKVDFAYQLNAINCWGAACLWVLVFLFSTHQVWANSKS